MLHQQRLEVSTRGRGTYNITRAVRDVVAASRVRSGLCHVFVHHTSASLILCENADPTVRSDLEAFMGRLVPDGDPVFAHVLEGPDDMPAHVRSILSGMDLSLPVSAGDCALGTWQGVFLWEHRGHGQARQVTVTVLGD